MFKTLPRAVLLMTAGVVLSLAAALFGLRPATSEPAGAAFPGRNGKIVFACWRDWNPELYVMNADGTGVTQLTDGPADHHPDWSPDGTKITFTRGRGTNAEIYVMNADGSNPTNLTNNSVADIDSVWSPDGTKIAFSHFVEGQHYEIYVMNADGSNPINLTNNPAYDRIPHWSPDGTKLVFFRDSQIYVMNADGTGVTRLTEASSTGPDWSPDGTKIVFRRVEPNGNHEIYVMNADGSGETNLTKNPAADSYADWSPDGTKILFQSMRVSPQQLFLMNPDGTGVTQLSNLQLCLPGNSDWQSLPAVQTVEIDIKPGSEPNCFNNDGHGVIPVAIFSTAGFNAAQADPTTVQLDGQAVRVVGKGNTQAHEEDVNGDGLVDLVVQIEDTDGVYQEGDSIAMLTGETFDGTPFQGTDSICIVP